MKTPLLFVPVMLLVVIAACKKDDNKKNSNEQAVELITSSSWKIDTIGLDTDGNNEIDTELPFALAPCEKDDILSFSSDSTGIYSEGASKCNGSDPDSTPFNWMFKSNNTIINIDGDLNELLTGDISIITLNETSLKVSKAIDLSIFYPSGTKVVGHFKR
jgi:hypothetical protein